MVNRALVDGSSNTALSGAIGDYNIEPLTGLYLRIRVENGTDLYFDLSSDGMGWSNVGVATTPYTVGYVGLFINAPSGDGDSFAVFKFFRVALDVTEYQILYGNRIKVFYN